MKQVIAFAVLGVPVFLAALCIIEAWVLSYLWTWFVTPVFGVACPTYPQLIGLDMLAAMLTKHYSPEPKEKADEYGALVHVFVRPLLILGIGYILRHWFM